MKPLRADVIALDICGPVDTVAVPASTPENLDETARLVLAAGQKIVRGSGPEQMCDRLGDFQSALPGRFNRIRVVGWVCADRAQFQRIQPEVDRCTKDHVISSRSAAACSCAPSLGGIDSPQPTPGGELRHQRARPADVDQVPALRRCKRDLADVPACQPLLSRLDDDVLGKARRLRDNRQEVTANPSATTRAATGSSCQCHAGDCKKPLT